MIVMAGVWCVRTSFAFASEAPKETILASLALSPALEPLPYRLSQIEEFAPSWGSVLPGGSAGPSDFDQATVGSNREAGVHWDRAVSWGATNAVGMVIAYRQSQLVWGESRGKFHFKHDLRGDGMALNDEVSHLYVTHRLTRALTTGYQWVGMDSEKARRAAAYEAWLWAFAVEFPIDAFNPEQGFGVSDLVANTIGIVTAYHHTGDEDPLWDIQVSVKPSFFNGKSRVIAWTNEQYDDYIYWLTVRPIRSRWMPLSVGIGYSTTHEVYPRLAKEIHVGIGTSADRIGDLISPSVGRFLRPLNFYFANFGGKIVWR